MFGLSAGDMSLFFAILFFLLAGMFLFLLIYSRRNKPKGKWYVVTHSAMTEDTLFYGPFDKEEDARVGGRLRKNVFY